MNKSEFKWQLKNGILKIKEEKDFSKLVILCIVTHKIIGDCFGPLVGTKLLRKIGNIDNVDIFGTIDSTIGFDNIYNYLNIIDEKNDCILVIDSAVSNYTHIGKVCIANRPIILGKGINKKGVEIGDISIRAIVGQDKKMPRNNFEILRNISLGFVMNLADIVSDGIAEIIV